MALLTHLRAAKPEDCDDIYQTHLYSVRYTCSSTYNDAILQAWTQLLSPQSYLDTLNNPNKKLYIIEYKGNIQGFFQLDLAEAQLDAIYVHPFVHNQGLGTALLQRAEQLSIDAGLSFLKLYASLNSVAFYQINEFDSLGSAILPLNPDVSVECELMRKYFINR